MAEEKNVMNEEVETEETVENTTEEVVEESVETEETTEDEAVETSEEETEGAEEKPKKEGFFKKKKDKKDEQIEELNDRVKRQMAEFENFRKRSEKEKSMMFDMGAKNVIEKILPIVDNFERGFTTVEEADKDDAFVQGMQQVYKQLMTELESIGVTPIEAVGQEFNPDFHNAVMQVESEEYESGIVAQEFMKGYMYKDTVVRHSMVGVVS
ncbi:MAG: nucleotide exchange factor GrpE [Agathobacter sp.]|nr:nucleotide exchange factor GrpE [Agathobacter sp.]